MQNSKIALKPYIEEIEQYCNQRSHDELAGIIINLAKEIPVRERGSFLNKLYSLVPGKKIIPDEKTVRDSIFNRIDALKEDIQERIDSIEDGSYWETVDYEYDDYDDSPDYVSEDQIDELINLFEEAEQFFLDDQQELSRDIYQRLLHFFYEIEELKYSISDSTHAFDLKEARARYCRCVYDTSKKKDRINNIVEAIDLDASISDNTLILEKESFPMLQDIIDAKTGEMKDWDGFLKKWVTALKKRNSNRADTLLLEAILFTKGIHGVADLARKWGAKQPRGQLYYIQKLIKSEDWETVADACVEALSVIPNNYFREQAAEYLVQAGKQLKNKSFILKGKREKFISSPDETNLLELVDEASRQKVREKELNDLIMVYKNLKVSPFREDTLYTKLLLMGGELKAAYEDVKTAKSVGWSYGKAGIVFGSVLYVVCGKSETAKTVKNLLKTYADKRSGYSWANSNAVEATAFNEVLKGLNQFESESADLASYFEWAVKIGCSRIDHIVSNKHRRAYAGAASVLGALSECYILLDQKNQAQSLVNKFYSGKYHRYPAFKREVKSVFTSSKILSGVRL